MFFCSVRGEIRLIFKYDGDYTVNVIYFLVILVELLIVSLVFYNSIVVFYFGVILRLKLVLFNSVVFYYIGVILRFDLVFGRIYNVVVVLVNFRIRF